MPTSGSLVGAVAALAAVFVLRHITKTKRNRTSRIQLNKERVVILGASSGVGRALTKHYAARGARVYAIARREELVHRLVDECGASCEAFVGDFTNPEDMERLRSNILQSWGGVDTVHI